MTNQSPDVSPTGRYSITEAAKLLGVHRTTINRWSQEGLLRGTRSKRNGRIYFTGIEILKAYNS